MTGGHPGFAGVHGQQHGDADEPVQARRTSENLPVAVAGDEVGYRRQAHAQRQSRQQNPDGEENRAEINH